MHGVARRFPSDSAETLVAARHGEGAVLGACAGVINRFGLSAAASCMHEQDASA